MNGKASKGRVLDILAFRKTIFSHVPKREHYPTHIDTRGNDVMNMMVFGGVKYGHHLGHSTETERAARYELAKEDGQLKFAKVHIVVVSFGSGCISVRILNVGFLGYCCARLTPFSLIISFQSDQIAVQRRFRMTHSIACPPNC